MSGEKKIRVKDHARFNRTLDDIDSVHNPLPASAAETRRLAEETAAAASAAAGSTAAASAALLTALSGQMTSSADAADAAHRHLRETTFGMRGWDGGLKAIDEAEASGVHSLPSR